MTTLSLPAHVGDNAENCAYEVLSTRGLRIGMEAPTGLLMPNKPKHATWSLYGLYQSVDNFWSKVIEAPTGCWEWQGARNKGGYGRTSSPYWNSTYAHRLAWEMLRGDPPAKGSGFELDHFECHNHACVNVLEHIRLATVAENRATKWTISSLYCRQGHEMFGPGLYVNPRTGQRTCKQCVRDATDRWLDKDGNRERQNAMRNERRAS